MKPLSPAEEASFRRGFSQFVDQAATVHQKPREFFDVVRVGALEMGIGSALEKKLLVHVRGPTNAPADDVILEVRSTVPQPVDDCIVRPARGGSLEPLLFMSILGPRMPSIDGFVTLDDAPAALDYWVQAWDPGYVELAVSDFLDEPARPRRARGRRGAPARRPLLDAPARAAPRAPALRPAPRVRSGGGPRQGARP